MYVIYINDRPLTLRLAPSPGTGVSAQNPTHLTARYSGKARTILNYVDMLEKGSPKVLSVDLVSPDLEGLWKDFKSNYKWVPAAGGVVRNRQMNAYLAIYRRGSWDLPKGKIDAGEDEPAAALREVTEETGIGGLTLGEALPTTYHTYRSRKGRRILKPTYWFRMETDQTDLIPETEEDIERAVWMTAAELADHLEEFYESQQRIIQSVLRG